MTIRTALGGFAAAAAIAFAGSASAATYVATYTGVINGGYDVTGVFGAAGDISGQAFTASFTYDLDIGTLSALTNGQQATGSITSAKLKVGAGEYSFGSNALNLIQTYSVSPFNSLLGYVFHSVKATGSVTSELTLDGGLTNGAATLAQSLAPGSVQGAFGGSGAYSGYFGIEAPVGETQAYGYLEPTSYTVTAVPEPAAWALMIGGFGLAGVMLRRRSLATVRA